MSHILAILLFLTFIALITSQAPSPSNDLPLPGNGILNPASHYQRSRRSKFPKKHNFYHWYYFYLNNQTHFYAFCYHTAYGGAYDGLYTLLAEVTPSHSAQQLFRYDSSHTSLSDKDLHFEAKELGYHVQMTDPDAIKLSGRMSANSTNYFSGNQKKDAVWDIELHRQYGYYGQDLFEWLDEHWEPIIQWNTYGHFSRVKQGRLNINGEEITLDDSWIAYADMNWGGSFPAPPKEMHGEHDDQYAWGWYRVAIPASKRAENGQDDSLALIAGLGLTSTESGILKSMYGKFADLRFNSADHVEMRQVVVRNGSIFETTASSTNDGKVLRFEVERSDWTVIKDQYGEAKFPLTQVLTLETSTYLTVLKFTSTEKEYNRLLFPFADYIFSDFEGLGVTCHVKISNKKTGAVMRDEVVHTAGLEYGYKYDVKL